MPIGSIDRRVKGVVLLAVVLLAAVVLPNLVPRTVRGTAVLGQVPVPPHVGQCLLQSPQADGRRGTGTSYRLGGCTTQHYGEVAELVSDATIAARSTGDLASANACADEDAYLGWASPVVATSRVDWRPIDLTVITMDPTPVQRAFGQHWLVCVVFPATAGTSYTGSVHGALASGRLPSAFAQCLGWRSAAAATVPCDGPHPVEVFGTAELSPVYRDQTALDADCLRIATSAMRRADPTAGGTLTVSALPFHRDATGRKQPGFSVHPDDLGAGALCTAGVKGSRLLDGSLFGLGTNTLPWA